MTTLTALIAVLIVAAVAAALRQWKGMQVNNFKELFKNIVIAVLIALILYLLFTEWLLVIFVVVYFLTDLVMSVAEKFDYNELEI